MALLNFYMQTTGDSRNAGTTTADSPSVTSTNGDWGNAAANRFTAASGTPFSAVNIGEWVSISLDAATVAVFVAQITAVNGGGASIDVSTTERYGTAPATGATGRSARVGGAWATFNAYSNVLGVANSTPTSNVYVNVKAGSYSLGTSLLTGGSTVGVSNTFGIFRGYKTTPGDMDGMPVSLMVPGTDIPHFSGTTGRIGAIWSQVWKVSSCSFLTTGATANPAVTHTGVSFFNCFIEHQNANVASTAITATGGQAWSLIGCWLKTNAAANCINIAGGACLGNVFVNGLNGISVNSSNIQMIDNLFINQAADCIDNAGNMTGNNIAIIQGNTFYNPTGHAIDLSAAASSTSGRVNILNNLFHTITQSGKYALNFGTTGAPSLFMYGNSRYNVTNGMLNGTGDLSDYDTHTFSNDPLTNPGSGDFSFKASEALRNGFPYLIPGYSQRTYCERGMVQAVPFSVRAKLVMGVA